MTLRSSSHAAFRIERHASLPSTNDEALARARAGAPGSVWIVADAQTGGRGRSGRSWISPPGNLYASLLLRFDDLAIARAPELGFVAGVSLATALRGLVGGDTRLRIKWPNDITFDGAKLSGMLLESVTGPDGALACVIGIGVNCTTHPVVDYPTIDLQAIGTLLHDPDVVLDHISREMTTWLARWGNGQAFEAVRQAWLGLAADVGTPIRFAGPRRTLAGTFQTIDRTGRLLVETADGVATVDAGDVFMMPASSSGSPAARYAVT